MRKSLAQALRASSKRSCPNPICVFKKARRDTTPRQVRVHSCQLSMSSCSKVPEGLKPRTPASRMASLTCGGAALSVKTQDHTSVLSGPRGCHTRKVREVARSIEKLGKAVPTIGLMRLDRGPRRLSTSGRISFSYSRISGIGGSPTSFGPKQIKTWPLPGDTVLPIVSGLVEAPVLKAVFTAERCDHPTWYESRFIPCRVVASLGGKDRLQHGCLDQAGDDREHGVPRKRPRLDLLWTERRGRPSDAR